MICRFACKLAEWFPWDILAMMIFWVCSAFVVCYVILRCLFSYTKSKGRNAAQKRIQPPDHREKHQSGSSSGKANPPSSSDSSSLCS